VPLKILKREQCEELVGRKSQYICTRGTENEGVCNQDNGGPLIGSLGNKLLGVLTVPGSPCGGRKGVAVFVRVGSLVGWITHVVHEAQRVQ